MSLKQANFSIDGAPYRIFLRQQPLLARMSGATFRGRYFHSNPDEESIPHQCNLQRDIRLQIVPVGDGHSDESFQKKGSDDTLECEDGNVEIKKWDISGENTVNNEVPDIEIKPFRYQTLVVQVLVEPISGSATPKNDENMTGNMYATANHLRDESFNFGYYFIFSDLAIRASGKYRLKFTLFDPQMLFFLTAGLNRQRFI